MTSHARDPLLQIPFDVAVVIPTILKPTLEQAVRSIFAQDLKGRIQILIGIDIHRGSDEVLQALMLECPEHITMTVVDPGYSTAKRNGGVHSCSYGGSLRSALTMLANSRYVAYLDDDNWFAPNHLSTLTKAIVGYDWAFSMRWMVDPRNDTPICVDTWESVGSKRGVFAATAQGGFVDTSTMLLDKIRCLPALSLWSLSYMARGDGEDRIVYTALNENYRGTTTNQPTSYYRITETDGLHKLRVNYFAAEGYHWGSASRFTTALTSEADLEPDPTTPEQKKIAGFINAALACEQDDDPAGAMNIINQVLAVYPSSIEMVEFLGGFNTRLLGNLLQKARRCIKEGQYPEAVEILSGILQASPTDKTTLLLLAQLNLKLNNPDDAKTIFDYLQDTYPDDLEIRQELAVQKFKMKSLKMAAKP